MRATPAVVVPRPAPYGADAFARVSAMKLSLSRFIARRMTGRGGEVARGEDARAARACVPARRRPTC